jgi:hypothetical protein
MKMIPTAILPPFRAVDRPHHLVIIERRAASNSVPGPDEIESNERVVAPPQEMARKARDWVITSSFWCT